MSLKESVATVTGDTIIIVGAGTATIRAFQLGNDVFATAEFVDQLLTVDKKMLTVTADDKTRNFGEVNPKFTISYDGFAGSDSAADLDNTPVLTSAATVFSSSGDYDIVVTGGFDNNYFLTIIVIFETNLKGMRLWQAVMSLELS